jgi:Zn ribbon nucleic-acid-binding protein
MTPRPHHAIAAALATALVGATPTPAPAATAPTTPTVKHCTTAALTESQVAAGQTNRISCVDVPVGTPLRRSDPVIMRHYDGTLGGGAVLQVTGTTCTGAQLAISTSDWWNNKISSTEHVVCGYAKHWNNNNYTGTNELTPNGAGPYYNLTTLNNATGSVSYAP